MAATAASGDCFERALTNNIHCALAPSESLAELFMN